MPPLKAISFQRESIHALDPNVAAINMPEKMRLVAVPANAAEAGFIANSNVNAIITWVTRIGIVDTAKTPDTTKRW